MLNNATGSSRDPYADIRGACRPVHEGDAFAARHPRMPLSERAKIFSPFAAVKGYDSAIDAVSSAAAEGADTVIKPYRPPKAD